MSPSHPGLEKYVNLLDSAAWKPFSKAVKKPYEGSIFRATCPPANAGDRRLLPTLPMVQVERFAAIVERRRAEHTYAAPNRARRSHKGLLSGEIVLFRQAGAAMITLTFLPAAMVTILGWTQRDRVDVESDSARPREIVDVQV